MRLADYIAANSASGAVQAGDALVLARAGECLKASGVDVISACWPVGAVFVSVVSTNPATLLGFGTWSAFGAGRVLVGLDAGDPAFDTAEETGGAKTVVSTGTVSQPTFTGTQASLTHSGAAVADHAAHTHTFTQSSNATTPDLLTVNTAAAGVAASGTTGNPSATLTHAVTQPGAHTYTPQGTVSAPTFSGSATSVLQPYIVTYFWKRVS